VTEIRLESNEDNILTVADLARGTSLSESTIYTKINNGSIPVTQVRRPLLVSTVDIAKCLLRWRTSCSYRQAAKALRIKDGTVNSWI
jgi:hypothetical protein